MGLDGLVVATLLIVVGMVASVAFYRSLSEPRLLERSIRAVATRVTRSSTARRWVEVILTVLAAAVLVFFWTGAISVTLFIVLPLERIREVVVPLPYAIVAASRLLAFADPSAARELAKTVPLALLVLLLIGEPLNEGTLLAKATRLDAGIPDDTPLLVAVIALELGLRSAARLRPSRSISIAPPVRESFAAPPVPDEVGVRAAPVVARALPPLAHASPRSARRGPPEMPRRTVVRRLAPPVLLAAALPVAHELAHMVARGAKRARRR